MHAFTHAYYEKTELDPCSPVQLLHRHGTQRHEHVRVPVLERAHLDVAIAVAHQLLRPHDTVRRFRQAVVQRRVPVGQRHAWNKRRVSSQKSVGTVFILFSSSEQSR